MRRNECCVTIDNRRRKFLLVTASGEAVMQIAGVEMHVAGLDRNRDPEPAFSQPIAEMLTACLDRVLRSPTPLKVTMDQWLSTRMTAPNVDWALIDELVAWLTMRFVPQPQVLRDEAGGSETHWLPPAYCDVAYATHGLPECVVQPDESVFYYHDHATTFTDNVFVSKALAPALRVGAWTNEAELITGLGIATYDHSERGAASSEEGTAMALDDVERAMLKRRLYEEWKRGVGIGDQAVSPELMGNDRAFWDTIVYGAGEESDAVSAIGEYALGIASRAQLSWEANAQAVGRGAHIIARCPHCAWASGRRKCRRRPNPAHHEAGGFSGGGGAQRRPSGGAGRAIDLESIKRMIPDWEWTTALYRRKQKELVSQFEPCCSDRGWEAPMSKFNSNLRRYRLPKSHECEGCALPRGTIEEGLHMAARMHPGRRARLIPSWLKLGGPFIYKEWRLLTYWETFSGYVAPVDINALRGDVDDWLTVTKHNGERIDEAEYVQDILNETIKFMLEEWTMPDKLPTMEQWVASGVWMRGKAGTGRNTMIRIEGKEKRTRRYKGVDAALKSDKEIQHELREARRESMKIMQKSEGGKVRPVVVGGNELYRKMD
ncbi:unnamed protein product [Arctia plantaginis]|uniref:Uncharacterized protein n=1 Tax=Arctia plantaginis TaxID=874455 RepID=A0A8S0Z969_ARCPL|nr:unnamed protein product [Arctia plantaginis]